MVKMCLSAKWVHLKLQNHFKNIIRTLTGHNNKHLIFSPDIVRCLALILSPDYHFTPLDGKKLILPWWLHKASGSQILVLFCLSWQIYWELLMPSYTQQPVRNRDNFSEKCHGADHSTQHFCCTGLTHHLNVSIRYIVQEWQSWMFIVCGHHCDIGCEVGRSNPTNSYLIRTAVFYNFTTKVTALDCSKVL